MKTSNETNPIMIFAGTKWETGVVKSLLEKAEIKTITKKKNLDTLKSWLVAPGGIGSVKVFISASDAKKAIGIVNDFKKNAYENGE